MNTVTPSGINVAVLFASPKSDGFTAKLYEQFASQFSFNVDFIRLYDCSVNPCIDCKACLSSSCPFNENDDMCKILESIFNADIVICATPIYFNGVPAPFKSVMDRCQQLYMNKNDSFSHVLTKTRLGILLTTAGSDDSNVTDGMYHIFKMFFNCFHISFIEHITYTDTDNNPTFEISQKQIESVKKSINEQFKEI